MRTRVWALAVLVACAAPRPQPVHGTEVLTVEGKVENAPFRYGSDDLPNLPRAAFRAFPPATGDTRDAAKPVRYDGVSLDVILRDRMELAREADVAIVHGDGGVAVPVSLAAVRQLRPLLADKAEDPPPGSPSPGASALALVWPNLDNPGIDTDPRMRWWWVRGVRKIVIQSWTASYGRALQVPPGASNAARLGADVVSSQCISCHSVRGLGGTKGPELVGRDAHVRPHAEKLRNHLREASGMSAAPELGPGVAAEVVAFLDALVAAGPPQDEPAPPGSGDHEDLPPPSRPPGVR